MVIFVYLPFMKFTFRYFPLRKSGRVIFWDYHFGELFSGGLRTARTRVKQIVQRPNDVFELVWFAP